MAKVKGKWTFDRIVERKGRIVRDHVWVNAPPPDGDSRLELSRILALPVVSGAPFNSIELTYGGGVSRRC